MVMFSSRGSSLRSSMCEENNGLPFLDLYSLPASIRPSIQGNHFFRRMVGVQNDRDLVVLRYIVNVQRAADGSGNVRLELVVGHSPTGHKLGATIAELYDNGRLYLAGRFQYRVDGVAARHVDSRHSEVVVVGIAVQRRQLFTVQYA